MLLVVQNAMAVQSVISEELFFSALINSYRAMAELFVLKI